MHACLSSDLNIIKSVQVNAVNLLKVQLQTVLLLSFGIYLWLTVTSELRIFHKISILQVIN